MRREETQAPTLLWNTCHCWW